MSGDILGYQDIREFNGILGGIRGHKRYQGISEDDRGYRDISK